MYVCMCMNTHWFVCALSLSLSLCENTFALLSIVVIPLFFKNFEFYSLMTLIENTYTCILHSSLSLSLFA
jgi:hypothetical protein